ncbi:MAG: hypothetical protein AAFS03_02415 [Pseudomonadota bacterium]
MEDTVLKYPLAKYIGDELPETFENQIDSIRCLAMTSEAAEAEYEMIYEGVLQEALGGPYSDGIKMHDSEQATDRGIAARLALSVEVDDAERNGLMEYLSSFANTAETPGTSAP